MSPSDFRSAMRVLQFLVITASACIALVAISIVIFNWMEVILP